MIRWLKNIIIRSKYSRPFIYYLFLCLQSRKNFKINIIRFRGLKNSFIKRGAVLNGVKSKIIGDNNFVKICKNATLDNVVFHIHGNSNVVNIGTECRIENSVIWIEDNQSEISIGRNTTVGGAHFASTEDHSKILIGEDCMLAYGIDIRTGDSHGIYSLGGLRINKAADVIIGDHVWVGVKATILKGAIIGKEAVVGTGSVVVAGSYPAGVIIAGNPARIVKREITWKRSRL